MLALHGFLSGDIQSQHASLNIWEWALLCTDWNCTVFNVDLAPIYILLYAHGVLIILE